nr:hypothetical protein [uncultured bacterium]
MTETGAAGGETNEVVASLAQHFQSGEFRRAFSADAAGALASAGIEAAQVPRELMDAISHLSYDELTLLATMHAKLGDTSYITGVGCSFF